VDTTEIARQLAGRMIGHRNALAGKAEDALAVQLALHQAAESIVEHREDHNKAATTALDHWDGTTSDEFQARSHRLGRQLRITGDASAEAEKIVTMATAALSNGHATAVRLVEDFVGKAKQALDGGLAASGAGSPAALMQAVAAASDLERRYTRESITNLRGVHGTLTDATAKLRALRRHIDHDGVVDPSRHKDKHGHTHQPQHGGGKHGDGQHGGGKHGKGQVHDILAAARKAIGTRENPPGSNNNPFGPTAPWCSSFATAMWRKAGVDIPLYPFTGDVFHWGQRNGHAYHDLSHVRPGDVLLFGTGPQSPSTSTHIGIVEKVEHGQVTLIEGNSGPNTDQVVRRTHPLSSSIFYGGVHP
jgi:peptidoglycan DL-endopeptidase CwlO